MMMSRSNGESSGSSASSAGGGEFEIAKVLASLGKHENAAAVVEEDMRTTGSSFGGGESVGQGGNNNNNNNNCWGSKGKRWMSSGSSKRVVNKEHSSSPLHSPLPFDLNVDQPNVFLEECQNVDVKAEETYESADRSRVYNSPCYGGRSRNNLSEVYDRGQDIMAEKEARRVRRILANRESARQTIRRRQAFHEELSRKAAELASENESLKKSKELAVKEFQSLQTTNQNLKGQLSQTLDFKLGENKGEGQSSCPDTRSLHSANWAELYKKLSESPFIYPACLPPSDLNVSNLSQQYYHDPLMWFTEQENGPSSNDQNMPWCILPCPVFLPVSEIKNFSSLLLKDRDEGSSVDSKHDHSPSSVLRCAHNCPVVGPADGISRSLPSTQDECRNGSHQTPFGFSLGRGSQQIVPKFLCCPNNQLNTDLASATGMVTASTLPEKRKEHILRKSENTSTVAGAEARKRRKELRKLKTRLHCHLLGPENS